MDFYEKLEQVRSRWNVLDHPFYRRWSAGELSREELGRYSGQYRHAVVALAEACDQAARAAGPELREELEGHAGEERAHVQLWDAFVSAVDGDPAAPADPETAACASAWTSAQDLLEGLVGLYAIESGQPAISRTKLEGLVGSYGVEDGPATEYFALHAELDHRHAAESRRLIDEHIDGADEERLLAAAERVLRGNCVLLDGVEQRRPAA
jgi:pyrroloquinoline-quinone synthase